MKLSPIVFFGYNRPYHTLKSLNSIKENKLSSKTNIYIFIDGPKNKSDRYKVNAVGEVVKNFKGFKKKKIILRKKNYGLSKNFISGITQILKKHESVIVVEDDNLLSKHFLEYINKGLNMYKKDKSICAINGYSYPVNKNGLSDYFLVKGADTWGWATWKDSWNEIIWDPKKLIKKIKYKNIIKKKRDLLLDKINGKNDSYTIMFDLSMYIKNKYCLVPKKSYSTNIGLDGTGRHVKNKISIYGDELNKSKPKLNMKKISYSEIYNNRLKEFYRKNINLNFKSEMKIKAIQLVNKIIGEKLKNKIKIFLYQNDKIDFIANNKIKHKNYLNRISYIKKNFNLLKIAKKNFFVTLRDGKLKNINEANLNILLKIRMLSMRYKLNVIEIGGGVGQRYYEYIKLFGKKNSFKWFIVEQNSYFEYLKKYNSNSLKFTNNLENTLFKSDKPCLIIFSTSLQYMDNPYSVISKITKLKNVSYLLIENVPFTAKNDQKLIQRHYSDKNNFYSFFLFNQKNFMNVLKKTFKLRDKRFIQMIRSKNSKFKINFYDLFFSKLVKS
tara:strand:- start:6630 stop:8291 length:1662 start_codon:yes stop_codon:yes gene_type:complete